MEGGYVHREILPTAESNVAVKWLLHMLLYCFHNISADHLRLPLLWMDQPSVVKHPSLLFISYLFTAIKNGGPYVWSWPMNLSRPVAAVGISSFQPSVSILWYSFSFPASANTHKSSYTHASADYTHTHTHTAHDCSAHHSLLTANLWCFSEAPRLGYVCVCVFMWVRDRIQVNFLLPLMGVSDM